jgi:hypothetical protein
MHAIFTIESTEVGACHFTPVFFFWRTIARMHHQKAFGEQVVLKKEVT